MQHALNPKALAALREAVLDQAPITGLTHQFYRYPARFSPMFVRACIEQFTQPGDLVLDPYMGGGTSVVEAMIRGRRSVGSDINELAVFVARVKTSILTSAEIHDLTRWADDVVPSLNCRTPAPCDLRVPRNMNLASVRWLRKQITLAVAAAESTLTTDVARRFARCVVLNVGQWALNGRKRIPSVTEFRQRLATTTHDMLQGSKSLTDHLGSNAPTPIIGQNDAEHLPEDAIVRDQGPADLVVTSPPYPGVHMLYHRWQVDGRKETDAPYWITGTNDGQGTPYYNFADRRRQAEDKYYEKAERAFLGIRSVLRKGATMAQLIAFADPDRQFPRYLRMLNRAGFAESRVHGSQRIWRPVPGRRWHANSKGRLPSSREVALIHVAR